AADERLVPQPVQAQGQARRAHGRRAATGRLALTPRKAAPSPARPSRANAHVQRRAESGSEQPRADDRIERPFDDVIGGFNDFAKLGSAHNAIFAHGTVTTTGQML